MTDRSGAFTLNGLRPGSTYCLIAEADDERGPLDRPGRGQDRRDRRRDQPGRRGAKERPRPDGRPDPRGPGRSRTARSSSRPRRGLTSREVNREDCRPARRGCRTSTPARPRRPRAGRPQLSAPEPERRLAEQQGGPRAGPASTTRWRTLASILGRTPTAEASAIDPGRRPVDRGRRAEPAAARDRSERSGGPDDADSKPTRSGQHSTQGRAKVPPPDPNRARSPSPPEASADEAGTCARPCESGEPRVGRRDRPAADDATAPDRSRCRRARKSDELVARPAALGLPAMPPIGGDPVAALEAPRPTASPPDVAPGLP